jgi:glycosyltransferase involved in cell wall biosynthesis
MTGQRISVIIPAFNAERFLGEALDSVFAQGIEDPEVVVVDAGSTDGTAAVAERYGRGVRVIRQPRSGSGRARNAGLAATSGELVAFLDADDLWSDDKTRVQLPVLQADRSLGLVFCDMIAFDETGSANGTYFQERGFDGRCGVASIFLYDMISTPTVILRRSLLPGPEPFDEGLPIGQDTDLWFRLALRHPFAVVPRPLVRRRFHEGNVTRDARRLADCVVEVWGRYLDSCLAAEPAMARRLRDDFARKRWNLFFLEGCAHLHEGRRREARERLSRAIHEVPLRPRAWAFWLASWVPGRRGGRAAQHRGIGRMTE